MARLAALLLGMLLLVGSAVPALAVTPNAGCPTGASDFVVVDQQGWWDATVAGFETEGITVYVDGNPANGFTAEFDAFAVSSGFADGQALYDYIWGPQWQRIDRNGDLLVCMKGYPHTPGNPAYLFNGIDNSAH